MARAFRDALGVRPLRLPRACWRLHAQPSDPQSSGLYKAVTDASIGAKRKTASYLRIEERELETGGLN